MGLLSALSSGVSGLQTFGLSLQTIGNNIANISTVGFKSQRTEFADLFGQQLGGSSAAIGRGVTVARVVTSFSQGSFSNTERLTDLGIDGEGFFVLSDGSTDFYTRNGQFSVNANGFLVNSTDLKVQGNLLDITGQSLGRGDVNLNASSAAPRPTGDGTLGSGVSIRLNLNATETALIVATTTSSNSLTTLASGDLSLNGTNVGASLNDGSGATGVNATSSALAISNAINLVTGATGVTAKANPVTYTAPNAFNQGDFSAGTSSAIIINGTTVDLSSLTGASTLTSVVSLIDSASIPGIDASEIGGKLTITSLDGRNIEIQTQGGDGADSGTAELLGIITLDSTAGNGEQNQAQTVVGTGTITLTSNVDIIIAGTDPTKAGLTATTIGTTGGFDATTFTTAEISSNFSTTLSVFDSLGAGRPLTVYFSKTGDNQWEWNAAVDGSDVVGGSAGTPFVGAAGTLTFNTSGQLIAQTQTAGLNFDFGGGAVIDQVIAFDFGVGADGSTQFANDSSVNSQTQDGFSAGTLSSISIGDDGVITGFFTNGQTQGLAQIVLGNFTNPEGLSPVGRGLYRETLESGLAIQGTPNIGGFGVVVTNTLELSNVDLANEFVNLVTTQRAFQANTRIITTVDQLLADIVNIIR